MFPVVIRDPSTGAGQSVSPNGESVSRSYEYSEPHVASLAVDNQIYNVVKGVPNWRFVITGILIATSRTVVGEKTIHLYEATEAGSDIHEQDILKLDMVKSERFYIPLANVATLNARHINAHADDSDFNITVFGYYIPS